LNPITLLDLIRSFIVYEKSTKEESKTGITTIETVKKLAAYHQYYAVNKAVASTLRATALDGYVSEVKEDPIAYGLPSVEKQPKGDRKAGVVWHTQGSGKSLSMVFYTGKIVLALDNPTVLVITDRNDLDDQLFDTFASSSSLLKPSVTPKHILYTKLRYKPCIARAFLLELCFSKTSVFSFWTTSISRLKRIDNSPFGPLTTIC